MKKLINKIFDKLGYIPKVKHQLISIEESNVDLLMIEKKITSFQLFRNNSTFSLEDFRVRQLRQDVERELQIHLSKYITFEFGFDKFSDHYICKCYIRVVKPNDKKGSL